MTAMNVRAAHVPKVHLGNAVAHVPSMGHRSAWRDSTLSGPGTHGYVAVDPDTYVGDAPVVPPAAPVTAEASRAWWQALLAYILSPVSAVAQRRQRARPAQRRAGAPAAVAIAARARRTLLACVHAAWKALGLDGDDMRVVFGFLIVLVAVVFVAVTVGLSVGLAFRFYHLGLGA